MAKKNFKQNIVKLENCIMVSGGIVASTTLVFLFCCGKIITSIVNICNRDRDFLNDYNEYYMDKLQMTSDVYNECQKRAKQRLQKIQTRNK